MIVTVGNTKGGVGKTTLALQVALSRALAGRDVLLVDGDRQGSAQTAVGFRTEAGSQPGLTCVQYVEGPVLRAQVRRLAPKHDDVVIDAGGRDSTALRAALYVSDILVVPFAPRSIDVWALGDMAALIDEARSARDGLTAWAVLNAADPGSSTDNIDAAKALADFPQMTLLDAPIRRRKAFANATGLGLSVNEMVPRDPKASDEIGALVRNVFNIAMPSPRNGR